MLPTLRRSARIRNKTANTDHGSISSLSSEPLHCICNKPQDLRIMICCDKCNIWHHHNCIGLSKLKVNQLSRSKQSWFCDKCKATKSTNKHKKRRLKRKSNTLPIDSPPKKRHKTSSFSLSALLTSSNQSQSSFVLPFAPEADTDIEILSEEEDDDVQIQAGDKWIGSESFFKNKDKYERVIKEKKKAEMTQYLTDDEDDDREFVVLNDNKQSKSDICPLTLKKIEVPLKNLFCSHVFEKDAIRNYKNYLIKNEKESRCPVPGCQKVLWWVG